MSQRWSHHWELPTVPPGIFLLCNVSYLTTETDGLGAYLPLLTAVSQLEILAD